jgi:hypothetical protein
MFFTRGDPPIDLNVRRAPPCKSVLGGNSPNPIRLRGHPPDKENCSNDPKIKDQFPVIRVASISDRGRYCS